MYRHLNFAGTAVDEIVNIGGCKTDRVPRYYIGATASAATVETAKGRRDGGSRRERDNSYATAMDFPPFPAFQEDLAACRPQKGRDTASMGEMMCDPAQNVNDECITTQGSTGMTTVWGRGGFI